jgi:hypothetical protein
MSEDTERTVSPGAAPGSVPAQRTARQRRPTGAPPPLPHPFTISTTAWLVLAVVIVACAFLISAHTPWLGLGDRANTWCLRLLAEVRTPWLTDLARGIKAAGGGWGVTVVGLSVVALTMVFRRWRHLLVFLGALFFLEIVGMWIYSGLSRPRPYGIPVTAFRYFTPNAIFPVVYRRGRTAHVDVSGKRGDAIRLAIRDQLGLTVLEVEPVGLESSAGSTPLRLRVEGGPDEYVFAKLYTKGQGTQRFDSQPTVGARFTGLRIYTFPGGCASYRFGFAPGASPLLIPAVDGLVAFVPRVRLVNYVRAKEGLALCGRGASCPG